MNYKKIGLYALLASGIFLLQACSSNHNRSTTASKPAVTAAATNKQSTATQPAKTFKYKLAGNMRHHLASYSHKGMVRCHNHKQANSRRMYHCHYHTQDN